MNTNKIHDIEPIFLDGSVFTKVSYNLRIPKTIENGGELP